VVPHVILRHHLDAGLPSGIFAEPGERRAVAINARWLVRLLDGLPGRRAHLGQAEVAGVNHRAIGGRCPAPFGGSVDAEAGLDRLHDGRPVTA
jgi:hypothetical protein